MKKLLLLTLVVILTLTCLASCKLIHSTFNIGEHTYEYIQYETGHFKQYTCGCPSPEIMGEHCDNDENGACDVCGYLFNSSGIAQIVLNYEQDLRDELDKLHAEHPEYNYYYQPVTLVYCTLALNDEESTDNFVTKHDINNVFANADIRVYSKSVSLTFERAEFTENIHQKLKQIGKDVSVKKLYVEMGREWYRSYMPKIEYYTDNASVLEYERAPYAVSTENSRDIIIKTKAEYDAYLDELLESWVAEDYLMAQYQIEIINNARDKYDEAFFEENALILTRMITRGSGSIKLTVNNLYVSENKVYVVIRTDKPIIGTDDMQYAFFAFAVDKDDVVNVNEVVTLE